MFGSLKSPIYSKVLEMAASRAPEVYAVAAVFLALTWITALLRCYVRGVVAKKFELEDYLAMLALVS